MHPSVGKFDPYQLNGKKRVVYSSIIYVILLFISFTFTLPLFSKTFHNLSHHSYYICYLGGLVSAVAGKGYVILAADTRLSRGYEILSRNHVSSRIWRVQRSNSVALPTTTSNTTLGPCDLIGGGKIITKQQVTNIYDGAYILSAGCSSDCEALKRRMQMDIRALTDWNSGRYHYSYKAVADDINYLSATGVATALGHTLYSRRGFPYYSFCIAAGMEPTTKSYNAGSYQEVLPQSTSIGVVHVYDAIGSHERVAVAAAGNGRELLQPILDRFFSVSNLREVEQDPHQPNNDINSNKISTAGSSKDGNAIEAKYQRVGLSLHPPVKTCVECSCEEAVALLVRAYRAVSEREITVGDEVVMYIIQEVDQEQQQQQIIPTGGNSVKRLSGGSLEIRRFALKKH
jgi:20S proteasome subunit beta 6